MQHSNKYHNIPTVIDGHSFDSKKEARRYQELRLLEHAGEIRNLQLQPAYRLDVNGVHVCDYRADFSYVIAATAANVTEDVKGVVTPVFALKSKLMRAVHGIDIVLV